MICLLKSVQSMGSSVGLWLTWLRKLPVHILGPWEGFQSFRCFETSVTRRLVFPLRGDGSLHLRERHFLSSLASKRSFLENDFALFICPKCVPSRWPPCVCAHTARPQLGIRGCVLGSSRPALLTTRFAVRTRPQVAAPGGLMCSVSTALFLTQIQPHLVHSFKFPNGFYTLRKIECVVTSMS